MPARAVSILWVVLSLAVAAICSFSLLQPAWLVEGHGTSALGVLSYCVGGGWGAGGPGPPVCGLYGGQLTLAHIPTPAWQVAALLSGSGCVLCLLGSVLALATLCVPTTPARRLAAVTGTIQATAVLLLAGGLLAFPVGWDSPLVGHHCPDAAIYRSGRCHVGWAYMLAIVGTALGAFLPFYAHHTDVSLT